MEPSLTESLHNLNPGTDAVYIIGSLILLWMPIAFFIKAFALRRMAKNDPQMKQGMWKLFVPVLQFAYLSRMASLMSKCLKKDLELDEDMRRSSEGTYYGFTHAWYGLCPATPMLFLLVDSWLVVLSIPMYLYRYYLIFKRYAPGKEKIYTLLSAFGLFPFIAMIIRNNEPIPVPWVDEKREEIRVKYDVVDIYLKTKAEEKDLIYEDGRVRKKGDKK